MAQVTLTQDAQQRPPVVRSMTIGINVADASSLPKVGREITKFIGSIDNDHGTFDITLDVNVGGYIKAPASAGMTVNHYHNDVDDYEGVD